MKATFNDARLLRVHRKQTLVEAMAKLEQIGYRFDVLELFVYNVHCPDGSTRRMERAEIVTLAREVK